MIDIRKQIVSEFAKRAVAQREELALKMVLHGQFPSLGWTIGERVQIEEENGQVVMRHECCPIPPRAKT